MAGTWGILMRTTKVFTFLTTFLWMTVSAGADTSTNNFPIGSLVVVTVSQFIPTMMRPDASGYPKALAIHPGKRAIVIARVPRDPEASTALLLVKWEDQYWQEWTEPPTEGYLDNNIWFMAQKGKWVYLKSLESTIDSSNLVR